MHDPSLVHVPKARADLRENGPDLSLGELQAAPPSLLKQFAEIASVRPFEDDDQLVVQALARVHLVQTISPCSGVHHVEELNLFQGNALSRLEVPRNEDGRELSAAYLSLNDVVLEGRGRSNFWAPHVQRVEGIEPIGIGRPVARRGMERRRGALHAAGNTAFSRSASLAPAFPPAAL